MTLELGGRILHATTCMVAYVRTVVQPMKRAREEEEVRCRGIERARWRICALLVRDLRQRKQQAVLDARKAKGARAGLVCANTRNVGRLAPRGGVVYNETRRNRERIQASEVYVLRRWPRRDKCGPTLARLLHYLWGIT